MKAPRIAALFLASLQLHSAVLTVCASGCTYTLSQFQNALTQARDNDAGDIVQIKAGETAGDGLVTTTLPVRNGGTSLITIRSSECGAVPANQRINPVSDLAHVAHINAPFIAGATYNYPSTPSAVAFYKFECIQFENPASIVQAPVYLDLNIGGSSAMKPAYWPHDIIFDRVMCNLADNIASKQCLSLAGERITVTNSYCYGVHDINISDTECIAGFNLGGFINVRNTQFSNESLNFITGGAHPLYKGALARDLTLIGNYFYKPWKLRARIKTTAAANPCLIDPDGNGEWWKDTVLVTYKQCQGTPGNPTGTWQTVSAGTFNAATANLGNNKNDVDLKDYDRALIKGNLFQNGWDDPAVGGQHGTAFILNDVDAATNTLWGNVSNGLIVKNKIIGFPQAFGNGVIEGDTPYFSYPYNRFIGNLASNIGNDLFSTGDATLCFQFSIIGNPGAFPTEFRNNTCYPGATTTGTMISMDSLARNVTFNSNVADMMQHGVFSALGGGSLWYALNNAWPEPRSFGKNVLSVNQTCDSPYPFIGTCIALNLFVNADNNTPPFNALVGGRNNRHPLYMSDFSWYNLAAVGFTDAANGDFSIGASSPFSKWGLNGADPGINQAELDALTAHAADGAYNANLDFLIRGVDAIGSSTARVTYSTPTLAAATVTFSRFGDATSGTTVTYTDSGGAVDRSHDVAGLGTGRWFYKIASGGVTVYGIDPVLVF